MRKVLAYSSLEIFKQKLNRHLLKMLYRQEVGLDYLEGPFQLYDSMTNNRKQSEGGNTPN